MIGLATETKHTKLGYPVTRENGNEGYSYEVVRSIGR